MKTFDLRSLVRGGPTLAPFSETERKLGQALAVLVKAGVEGVVEFDDERGYATVRYHSADQGDQRTCWKRQSDGSFTVVPCDER